MATDKETTPAPVDDITENLGSDFAPIVRRDAEEVAAGMEARLQRAESLDDLFDAFEGKSADALVGLTVKIDKVAWDVYDSTDGPVRMALVEGVDLKTGEQIEFPCTGRMTTRFLYRAAQLDLFPITVRIEGKKTRSGQTALNFVRP